MELLYAIIAMLLAITISDILYEILEKVPLIFIQIFMGCIISFLPFFKEFELEPELFMIIVIKPLIFSEAQHVSKDELKKHKNEIFSLSFTLVIITILVTGVFMKIIIHSIPLTIIFILAAMTIPTNVNFVKSISSRFKFPKGILAILEGESLFNDSIAIVMFDFVLAASLTGKFSLSEYVSEFLFIIIGGIVVGFVLGVIIVQLRIYITRKDFENPPMMVIIQLITPFIVYIIAEDYAHVSGILAVIVAGMVHIVEQHLLNLKSTKLQVISNITWDVVEYVLEGLVSIILGISIPSIIKGIMKENKSMFWELILIAILLYFIVIGLRYVWIMINPKTFKLEKENISKHLYRSIFALSGVHGTITLATALSIPDKIPGDVLSKNDLIFIATIVILISLIVPAIFFPLVLNKKEEDKSKYDFESARLNIITYTISQLELLMNDTNYKSLGVVLRTLRGQMSILKEESSPRPEKNKIQEIFNFTTEMEINIVDEIVREGKVSKEVGEFYKLYSKYNKKRLSSFIAEIRIWLIKKKLKRLYKKSNYNSTEYFNEFMKQFDFIKETVCERILQYLNKNINNEEYYDMSFMIEYYERKMGKDNHNYDFKGDYKEIRTYYSKAFSIELTLIQDYLEGNMISAKVASELREQVSYDEMIYINK